MPLRRAGTIPNTGVRYGPGSAAHHAAKSGALRCVRGTGKTFSFINIKFFKFPGDSYPPSPNRSYDRRVLSNEGALLEASLKWDRAKAWPGRGNPSRPDAAPAATPRKRGLGGPWVTVRAHYGALP